MIETSILAMTDKYDPAGVLCLAAIPVLIIALIPFSKGPIAGSGTNCIAFFIFVLWLAGPEVGDSGGIIGNAISNNEMGYITNESQTKWMKKPGGYALDEEGAIFIVYQAYELRDEPMLFIPAEETKVVDGWIVMKETGSRPTDDDYYIYDEVYPTVNVPMEAGGDGIPQWVYHPACLVYITGFFALPALGLGAVISRKL